MAAITTLDASGAGPASAMAPDDPMIIDSADDGIMVQLITSDSEVIETSLKIAKMSGTIDHMINDIGLGELGGGIPLYNVSGKTLQKVLVYCEHHKNDTPPPEKKSHEDDDNEDTREDVKIDDWDRDFFNVDYGEFFEILMAANYLDIKKILDVGSKIIADQLKGMEPEEIRKTFGIKNDYTPEEEAKIREENSWAIEAKE